MRILLLGSTGLLGNNIMRVFSKQNIELFGVARSAADINFDLTDEVLLSRCFTEIRPDVVINAAAIVSLAFCETQPLQAYEINTRMISKLVELCEGQKSYFIQISTDHFYLNDGDKSHNESTSVKIVNEYARTKYLGECLANTYENSLVVRTNIVGLRGRPAIPTFLEWAIKSLETKNKMMLFDDFYTSSIHAGQLAYLLLEVLKVRPNGILNLASSEVRNKKDFIMKLAEKIHRQGVFEWGSVKSMRGVMRAESLGLDVGNAENLLGHSLPDFECVMDYIAKEYRGEVI